MAKKPKERKAVKLEVITLLGELRLNIGDIEVELSIPQAQELVNHLQNAIEVAEDFFDQKAVIEGGALLKVTKVN